MLRNVKTITIKPMKKLYFSALILFSFGVTPLSAQRVLWQKDMKSSTQDFLSQLTTTIDRQFLVTGSSLNKLPNNKENKTSGYDYHLVKLNQQGETLWQKSFGGYGHDFLSAAISTMDGGFFIAGNSFSEKGGDKKENNFGGSDLWLIKISEEGTEEWQKSIGTTNDDEVAAVIQSSDQGFFIASSTSIHDGFGGNDVWITKLDKKGDIKSNILLGGNGLDLVQSIIPTKDGGCLVGIYSRSSSIWEGNSQNATSNLKTQINSSENKETLYFEKIEKTEKNNGEGDYWIVKLSAEGTVLWQKNYGGREDDKIKQMALTANGYIIAGESRSPNGYNKRAATERGTDIWIIAMDDEGRELWQKSYNIGERDALMSLNTIWDSKGKQVKSFLLGGYSQSDHGISQNDETFWLLNIDSNGEEIWRKHIKGESKKTLERLSSAEFNSDGSYVLAGTSAKEVGNENWKILKIGGEELEKLIEKENLKVYPNPVADYCYVEIGVDFNEAQIQLYDMSGRLLKSIITKNPVTKINTQDLIQGVYLISIKTQNKISSTKIIKI